jgi:hypothetical protein
MRVYFGLEMLRQEGVNANGSSPRFWVNENRYFPDPRLWTVAVERGSATLKLLNRSVSSYLSAGPPGDFRRQSEASFFYLNEISRS